MKRSRFSEEQIIGMLKELEAGAATADYAGRSHFLDFRATLIPTSNGGLVFLVASQHRPYDPSVFVRDATIARLILRRSRSAVTHRADLERCAEMDAGPLHAMALHRAPAGPCRTALSRASMAACATNCSPRRCSQARAVIAAWVADYNTARPHSALVGYQTPAAHAAKL